MKTLCIRSIHLVDIIRVHRQNRRCQRHADGATVTIGSTVLVNGVKLVFRGRRLPREWSYGGWKTKVRVLEDGAVERNALKILSRACGTGTGAAAEDCVDRKIGCVPIEWQVRVRRAKE